MGEAEGVERVAGGLDMLADVDLDAVPDGQLDGLLTALQRLGHRLDARLGEVARAWAHRGVWTGDGSKSPAARMARDGHRGQGSARTILWRGRCVAATPIVAEAFAAGDLSADQVDALLAARAGREMLFARDEQTLVDQARTLRYAQLCKALAYWRRRADAELGRDDGAEPCARPNLSLTPVGDVVAIDGQLDPIGGATVTAALDAIGRDLAADDRACGRPERCGGELRAAALVEMARRAMAMPAGAPRARILLQIVCGHDSFRELCELSNGVVIHPGVVVPYLDALDIQALEFDTRSHAVRASSQRSFTGALRGVVQVRDRHCQHPSGCDEPIDRCDADHIQPHAYGGITEQDNGQLLCTFHNRIEPEHARPPGQFEIRWITLTELTGRGP